MKKRNANRQQIISEYLTGEESFKALAEKYDVNARTIQSWVRSVRKHTESFEVAKPNNQEIKQLQKQLEQTRLKNELLEDGPFSVKNILARTALELPDPELKILGIDPFKRVSKKNLFILGLIYKAKIFTKIDV